MARELQECQIAVHLSKAISSLACANLALKTAEDNHHRFPPHVINTVKIGTFMWMIF